MANRKETALDLGKLIDKGVIVKLMGGREVHGILKGYDQLLNLVLDEGVEYLRDPEGSEVAAAAKQDPLRVTDKTRTLGLAVCRGTAVIAVSPSSGAEEIANPFLQPEEEG